MPDLAELLVETGLLRFGLFHEHGASIPFQIDLNMLPSYPHLLAAIVDEMLPHLPPVDHLLAAGDSVPLGVALSLRTGIPLVYSRGSGAEPVRDLVGAYDIGHPAVLLANALTDANALSVLARGARRVGLDVRAVLAVLDAGAVQVDGLNAKAILRLPDVVARLLERRLLPGGQGRAVLRWIEERNTRGSTPHPPDSAAP